jgi:hypothetical protein
MRTNSISLHVMQAQQPVHMYKEILLVCKTCVEITRSKFEKSGIFELYQIYQVTMSSIQTLPRDHKFSTDANGHSICTLCGTTSPPKWKCPSFEAELVPSKDSRSSSSSSNAGIYNSSYGSRNDEQIVEEVRTSKQLVTKMKEMSKLERTSLIKRRK